MIYTVSIFNEKCAFLKKGLFYLEGDKSFYHKEPN